MTYSNTWKIANGAILVVGSNTWEDATIIGIPGDEVETIEITNLGSTRKEYALSDMPDAEDITATVPYTGTRPAISVAGSNPLSCSVQLPKTGKVVSFSAFLRKVTVSPAEVDGKLAMELTLKPTSATSEANA